MSARESPRLLPWRSALPTQTVSPIYTDDESLPNRSLDANQFKDAFIKAQKENEALFNKAEEGASTEEAKEEQEKKEEAS